MKSWLLLTNHKYKDDIFGPEEDQVITNSDSQAQEPSETTKMTLSASSLFLQLLIMKLLITLKHFTKPNLLLMKKYLSN